MSKSVMDDLLYLMSRLRDPIKGCPWDRAQNFESIVPHTIEEAYELADAVENQDLNHVKEELGDVLFQVIFLAELGREQGAFDFDSIVSLLIKKLLRRHPHIFPGGRLYDYVDTPSKDLTSIQQAWETIKTSERQGKQQDGVLDDVPLALPALTRAVKLQKRVAKVGFDWSSVDGVLEKLQEELRELEQARVQENKEAIHAELGDVLFCISNLARHLNVEPESSLRACNQRFEQRFRFIEHRLKQQGLTPDSATLLEMDTLWDEAKLEGL